MYIQAKHISSTPRGDWAPDAVLAPSRGQAPSEPSDTVSFFGVQLPSAALMPKPQHPPTPPFEPRVWAPDAVLVAPPGCNLDPIEEKGTVSFFGAEIPAHLLHRPLY